MQLFLLKRCILGAHFYLQKYLPHDRNGHGIFVLCLGSLAINLFLDPWRMLRVALGSSGARSEFNSPGERWDVCPAEPKNAVLQALRLCWLSGAAAA